MVELIDIQYDSRQLPDTYQLYKKADIDEYITRDQAPFIRFRARDEINFQQQATATAQEYRNTESLTIRALILNSKVEVEVDDFVYDVKEKIMWRISNIMVDDDNQMKEYSRRPRKFYILTLTK